MSLAVALLRMGARALLALVLVSLLCWTLVECAPGSTSERAALASRAVVAGDLRIPPAARAEIVREATRDLQLHHSPLWRGVLSARLDFGLSWRDSRPASESVLGRAGAITLVMAMLALVLAFVIGLLGAVSSAGQDRGVAHKLLSVGAALMLSVPLPWLAMIAIDGLAYGAPLQLFPSGGLHGGTGLLLPVLVMTLAPAAVIWRHAHSEMRRLSTELWVVAARARGNTERRIFRVLMLKSCLPQVLPLAPVLLAYLLAASVIVERVFALDGAGNALADAAQAGDAPVLVAFASVCGACIALCSSLTELAIGRLDPRGRSR